MQYWTVPTKPSHSPRLIQIGSDTPTPPPSHSLNMLEGSDAEQPLKSQSEAPSLLSTPTCSHRPSGIAYKFFSNNLPCSPVIPKKKSARKSFKGKKSKERSADNSPAPINSMKQKLLEHYFSRCDDWTNGEARVEKASLWLAATS